MPDVPVRDIMVRSKEIYESYAGPHDVTVLINAFMGAWVHPWEVLRPELEKTEMTEAYRRGWFVPATECAEDVQPARYGDILRYMRNALAHGNVQFVSGEDGKVDKVRLWNCRGNTRTWGPVMDKQQLKEFFYFLIDLVDQKLPHEPSQALDGCTDHAEYCRGA